KHERDHAFGEDAGPGHGTHARAEAAPWLLKRSFDRVGDDLAGRVSWDVRRRVAGERTEGGEVAAHDRQSVEGGFEQRDTEALALARQHERIGERVEVGDDAIRRLHPERVKEMDALDSLRESCELREVEHVRSLV